MKRPLWFVAGMLSLAASATADAAGWPFASRQSVKDAFDAQALIDKSDRTEAACPDVHGIMSCRFVVEARANYADDVALFGGPGAIMPDELLEITGVKPGVVSNIGLVGNGRTPMHRYHYVGQFKTLVRVLAPAASEADTERLANELGLGSTPPKALRTSALRTFGRFACAQGTLPSAYIHCDVEPAGD
jgi:hypothetical protein